MIGAGLALAASLATPNVAAGLPLQQPRTTISLSPRQMLAWANAAQARGDKGMAAQIYEAMQDDADRQVRAEARFRLAQILAGEGKASAAATLLRQVIDDQPDAAPVRLALAQLLVTMGD